MQTVSVNLRTIAFRSVDLGGSDRTLVFVHGSGGNKAIWKSQHRLADRYQIVTLDLSGHGASDDVSTPPGPDTLSAHVADLAAVSQAVQADVLVGNSLGGAVVMQALIDEAVAPEAAVLVGSGAKLAVLQQLRTWLAEDFDRAIEFLQGENRLFADPDEALEAASKAAMRDCGRAVTERDFLTAHHFDVRDRLSEIAVPTLAVCGERDQLTPVRYHAYLAKNIEHGAFATVPNAAHLVMLDRPTAFNHALASFVDALS